MKRLKILLMYPFLVAVLTLSPYICIAYTQDILDPDKTKQEIVIKDDGYNIKDLQPTRYPNIRQTEKNTMQIWGGPYLTTDDQICFSFVNDSDRVMSCDYSYVLEVEVNEQWYELLRYDQTINAAFIKPIGSNYFFGVRKDIKPMLYPGKHRILLFDGLRVGEFEIVEVGSGLTKKPQNYDWRFLNISMSDKVLTPFGINFSTYEFFSIAEEEGLDVIEIDWQPITTADDSIEFTIDLINIDGAYWDKIYVDTKIDVRWRLVEYCFIYSSDKSKSDAGYPMVDWEPRRIDSSLNKIVLTKDWDPAGLFPGTHRIWGELRLKDGSSVIAYGEFEIVEASDNIQPRPSAWAKETVKAALAAKIVPQNLQGNYQQPITRAEFAALTMAYLESITESITAELLSQKNLALEEDVFSDANDEYILAAYALGIIEGIGNGIFDPNGNITREQLAIMLMRMQAVLNESVAVSKEADYSDRGIFSPWANQEIDYVTEQGIMKGIGDNRFDPKGHCTREQAIITFYRMMK